MALGSKDAKEQNGWHKIELGQLVTFHRGYDLPLKNMVNGKYPIVGSSGIIGFHDQLKTKGPGVVIGRSGNSIGKPFFIEKDYWPHNTVLYVSEFHSSDPVFVYYLLKTLNLRGYDAGSAVPTLNRNHIHTLDVLVPKSIADQRAIGNALAIIDLKIRINDQINKSLEAIGETLFKRWFVDFEFPNQEGKPYKSTGGKVQYSEELGKDIPEYWSVKKLGEFIDLDKGLSYKGAYLSEQGLPMINLGTIAPGAGFIPSGLKHYTGEYKEKHLVKVGDIVIANTDITQKREVLGSPALVPPNLNCKKALFTHHIFAVRKKAYLPNLFIYYLLQLQAYRDRVIGFATGTTVLALPKDAILELAFAVPVEETTLSEFEKIASTVIARTNLNTEQNSVLTQLRDNLLPKLTSGKIRVQIKDNLETT